MDIKQTTSTIESNFKKTIIRYGKIIDELNGYMSNMTNLAQSELIFYRRRQEMVSKKFTLIKISIQLSREIESKERDVLVSQKRNIRFDNDGDSLILAKNDFERKIIMANFMKDLTYLKNLMDQFVNFVKDSIETIDKMTFGLTYVKELESYKKHFK